MLSHPRTRRRFDVRDAVTPSGISRRRSTRRRVSPRRSLRTAATLVELLVALLLAGIVAAVVVRSRASSQAASTDALARADARRQLRAGAGAVLATLRGAAPAAGDLLALADSALELRITLGASVLCAHAPEALDAPPSVTLLAPVASTTAGDAASDGAAAWADAPDAGDQLLLLVRVPAAGQERWRWHAVTIAAPGSPIRAPCLGMVDALALRLPIVASLPAIVPVGAPVRLLRRGRWSVYRSGGRWYLGWRDTDAGGVGLDVVQPVSGPHDVLTRGARRPALAFGVVESEEGGSLAAVRAVSLRAQAAAVRADGVPAAESLAIVAAFRNGPGPSAP